MDATQTKRKRESGEDRLKKLRQPELQRMLSSVSRQDEPSAAPTETIERDQSSVAVADQYSPTTSIGISGDEWKNGVVDSTQATVKNEVIAVKASTVVPVQQNRPTAWKPGQSGNPNGRKAAGVSIADWFSAMSDSKQWTPAKLKAVLAKDSDASPAKRAAARQWLTTFEGKTDTAAGQSVDRICDRTTGKPVAYSVAQVNVVAQVDESSLAALSEAELAVLMAFRERVAQAALPSAAE